MDGSEPLQERTPENPRPWSIANNPPAIPRNPSMEATRSERGRVVGLTAQMYW